MSNERVPSRPPSTLELSDALTLFIPIFYSYKEKCSIKRINQFGVWMTSQRNAGVVEETANFGLLEIKTRKTQFCMPNLTFLQPGSTIEESEHPDVTFRVDIDRYEICQNVNIT
jgi:hypothetical protein